MVKKLLFLALFIPQLSNAQSISSIVLSPPAPNANDTLKFYVYLDFPYMGCAGTAYGSITGNDINASALHCMGMLTAICSDVDTIIIPPQPAGNYHFYFTLSSGYGGPPCSPGIVPDDSDTLDFSITTVMGMHEVSKNNSLEVFPNPSNGNLTIQTSLPLSVNEKYVVRNELGQTITQGSFNGKTSLELPGGMYIVSVPSLGLQQRLVVIK
ncbi:MAG TPA: T9SS type A sorting domain-containing protein [Flavobacteriales bacterium]|nr:T9SS type A sorting domain-containing protein [Flavobacteriales bacterium]